MSTRPYRPSNGSEGESFMGQFCYRCLRYDHPCDILSRTLGFTIDDPQYPQEWVEEDITLDDYLTLRDFLIALNERCTAFEAKP